MRLLKDFKRVFDLILQEATAVAAKCFFLILHINCFGFISKRFISPQRHHITCLVSGYALVIAWF